MSSFTGSFGLAGDESKTGASTRPFDEDGYAGYDPGRLDSFSSFGDGDSVKEPADEPSYGGVEDVFTSQPAEESLSPPPVYSSGGGFSSFSPERNGNGGFVAVDEPILPSPAEMLPEEGFALREWRRLNAIRLEEKEKREKEMLNQIIDEADEYKIDFYRRRKIACENSKAVNREKEKLFLESREKFHAEANKAYWKAIAELIPNEVPTIEKRGKKDKEKKPSVIVIQGPKPGKPTELSRMRQILVKLKHNPPSHMKPPSPPPPPPLEAGKDAKSGPSPPAAAGAVATPEYLAEDTQGEIIVWSGTISAWSSRPSCWLMGRTWLHDGPLNQDHTMISPTHRDPVRRKRFHLQWLGLGYCLVGKFISVCERARQANCQCVNVMIQTAPHQGDCGDVRCLNKDFNRVR